MSSPEDKLNIEGRPVDRPKPDPDKPVVLACDTYEFVCSNPHCPVDGYSAQTVTPCPSCGRIHSSLGKRFKSKKK